MNGTQRTLPGIGLSLVVLPWSSTDHVGGRDLLGMGSGDDGLLQVAQLRALKQQLDLALGEGPGLPTVDDLCRWYLNEHVGPPQAKSTITQYTRHARWIAEHFGALRLGEIGERHARIMLAQLREQEAHFTIRSFRRMLNLARIHGLFHATDPFARIKHHPNRREQFLTVDQLGRMWTELLVMRDEPDQWRPATDCLRLLMLTGIRQGEARTLEWSWVYPEWRTIRLPRSKTGPRKVKLSRRACELLESIERAGPHVFPQRTDSDRPLPYQALRATWVEVLRRIGVSGLTIHSLRHTAGTQIARNGATVPTLQDILGHRSPGMSLSYTHAASSDVDQALDDYAAMVVRGKAGSDAD